LTVRIELRQLKQRSIRSAIKFSPWMEESGRYISSITRLTLALWRH